MIFKNTSTKFGLVHKSFHWIMAALIFCLLCLGYKMSGMPPSPDKIRLVYLHKSFGITVLILAFGRVAWLYLSPRPGREPTVKPWEDNLARLVHFLIYVVFFAMPLSGWIMSSAGGHASSFFGLFDLPDIFPKSRELSGLARDTHNTLAVALLVLLFLHFSGASKHHVIDRDNTLRRMAWDKLSYSGGILLLGVLGALYLVPIGINVTSPDEPAPAANVQSAAAPVQPVPAPAGWIVDMAASSIKFHVEQSGQPFDGEFKNFTASIVFDPDNLPAARVNVQIPIAQITTGAEDRDSEAVKPEWFDAANFPMATFAAESFEKKEANQYIAHGTLTIRGVSKALDLPFTLDISPGKPQQAEMKSEITLNRLDFGIGQGQWQKTDMIADAVKISLYVKAQSAPE